MSLGSRHSLTPRSRLQGSLSLFLFLFLVRCTRLSSSRDSSPSSGFRDRRGGKRNSSSGEQQRAGREVRPRRSCRRSTPAIWRELEFARIAFDRIAFHQKSAATRGSGTPEFSCVTNQQIRRRRILESFAGDDLVVTARSDL